MIWLIGLGGVLGAMVRFILGNLIKDKTNSTFPLNTWTINISGSFLLGILVSLYTTQQISQWMWLIFGVGFCGAYTTFSTFSVETIQLIQKQRYKTALLYVITSTLLAIIAVMTCYYIIS